MFLKPKLTKANAAPMNGTSVEKISLQLGLSSSRCTEVRHFRRVRLDGSLIAQSRRERGRLVVARSQGAGFNFSLSCPVFRRLFVLQSMQRYLARRTAVIQKKLTTLLYLLLSMLSAAVTAAPVSRFSGSATLSAPDASSSHDGRFSLSAHLQKSVVVQANGRFQLSANLSTNAGAVCNVADPLFHHGFENLPVLLPVVLPSQSLPVAAHGN